MNRYTEKVNSSKNLKPNLPVDHGAVFTYHSILFMIVTENWEAASMAKCGYLPKGIIVDGFGHCDSWWVRGAHSKFLIDIA